MFFLDWNRKGSITLINDLIFGGKVSVFRAFLRYTKCFAVASLFVLGATNVSFALDAGYYLPAGVADPYECIPNFYCDGDDTYMDDNDRIGLHNCPVSHPNSEPGATSENDCYGGIPVDAGYYLPANATVPVECPTGYYCPGLISAVRIGDNTTTLGLNSCPPDYPNSIAGASSEHQCYTPCTAVDAESLPHSTGAEGNRYYGMGFNTCSVTGCVTGYEVKNWSGVLGNQTAERFAANMYDGVRNPDTYGALGAATLDYGVSGSNVFVVDYGDVGHVVGHARCSTLEQVFTGPNKWNMTPQNGWFAENVSEDTIFKAGYNKLQAATNHLGSVVENGSSYCYCQLDGLSGNTNMWVKAGQDMSAFSCAWGCAWNCAAYLGRLDADIGRSISRGVRDNLASTSGIGSVAICVAKSVNCAAGEYLPAGSLQCSTCLENHWCPGGTYTFNETTDGGINECPSGTYSSAGASDINQCLSCPTDAMDVFGDGTQCETTKFSVTTMNTTTSLSFTMSATGTFYVDCGDGGTLTQTDVSGNTLSGNVITRGNTTLTTYTCGWDTAGAHTIRFAGTATGYSTGDATAAISFYKSSGGTQANVAGISGSLGALFPTIGGGSTNGSQPRFYQTFYGCGNLTGNIPENLFAGISGAPATSMFEGTFSRCSKLSGSIPGNLFAGISGAPASDMFRSTFHACTGLSGTIPENLFSGISGAPASTMFSQTFAYCRGLTGSIPENLFSGISGAPASSMFRGTFIGCKGLSGSIPGNLFAGISGAPASTMFNETFEECTGLTGSIPGNLFSGISGAPASTMFFRTFYGCSGLTGSIPENLFAGISGAPASYMFIQTFYGCSGLTGSIPENLFAGISGAPAPHMFNETFSGCSGLTGSIPGNLFSGISGAPAYGMFSLTFEGCSGLTGSIPENLFSGISGAPAQFMFNETFSRCSKLSGSIPENLFAGISGAPASTMFFRTFYGCSGLTGSIPGNLFAGISGAPASDMFAGTFSGCSALTGPVPRDLFAGISRETTAGGQMSNVFTNSGLATSCPAGQIQYITGFEEYFSGKVACQPFCVDGVVYNGECHARCPVNEFLRVGDFALPLFADYTNVPLPVLNVGNSEQVCYVYFEPDENPTQPGVKIRYNNNVYHAVSVP